MEVSTEKTNSLTNISADISINGQKSEEVSSFKFREAILCKDGTRSAEVRIRISLTMTAMVRLNRIWRCNTISFASKFKVYKSLVTPFSFTADKHGPCLPTPKKGSRLSKPISYLEHKTMTGCRERSTSLWVCRNLFWQPSRDGHLHGFGMSQARTASPKPSFREPWRVGDAVVGRGKAGWTTLKRVETVSYTHLTLPTTVPV